MIKLYYNLIYNRLNKKFPKYIKYIKYPNIFILIKKLNIISNQIALF